MISIQSETRASLLSASTLLACSFACRQFVNMLAFSSLSLLAYSLMAISKWFKEERPLACRLACLLTLSCSQPSFLTTSDLACWRRKASQIQWMVSSLNRQLISLLCPSAWLLISSFISSLADILIILSVWQWSFEAFYLGLLYAQISVRIGCFSWQKVSACCPARLLIRLSNYSLVCSFRM